MNQLPVLVAAAVAVAALVAVVFRRPQNGLLVLAATVPFDGLLTIFDLPAAVAGWKEALVALIAVAALVSPRSVPWREITVPVWAAPIAGLIALNAAWAVFLPPIQSTQAMKIGYYYVLILLILLRAPFTARDLDRLVSVLMATGVLTAAYGVLQQFLGQNVLAQMGYPYNETIRTAGGFLRSFSSFTQPFSFGLFLTMVLLVAGAVALSEPRRRRNAAFLIASPLLVAGVALSLVRGAYLGLAVGVLVLAAVRYRWLFLGLPLLVVAVMHLPSAVLQTVLSSRSLGERSSGWADLGDQLLSNPVGIGPGSTGSVAEKILELRGVTGTIYQPDSQYVKALLELGVIGLWLLILLLVFTTATALTIAARQPDPESALALGIGATLLGAMAAATVSTYLEIFPMDVYFWLFLGVLTCLTTSGSTRSRYVLAEAGSRPMLASY